MLADNFDFLLTEVVEDEERDLPLQKFENILKNLFSYYYIKEGTLGSNQEFGPHLASLSNEKLELAA